MATDLDFDDAPAAPSRRAGHDHPRIRPARTVTGGPSASRQIAISFLVLLFIYMASPNRVDTGGDGFLVFPTAHSIIYERNLDLSEFSDSAWFGAHYGQTEVDGRTVDYFPWLTAAFTAPVVVVWDTMSAVGLTDSSGDLIKSGNTAQLQALGAGILSAVAAVVLGLVTRRLFQLTAERLDDGRSEFGWARSFEPWSLTLWTMTIGLGTALWSTASRAMWQHGPSMLLGGGAMLAVLHLLGDSGARRSKWVAGSAGALLALSYWERPVNVALVVVAVLVVGRLRRELLVPLLGFMIAAHLVIVGFNLLWLGAVLPPYFNSSRAGLHDALLEAAAANLVSPARGLLIFTPFVLGAFLLLLPARWSAMGREVRTYTVAAGLGTCLYLVAVSAYGEKWWAGHSFGPRFMSETLVLLAPLALLGIFGPRPNGRSPSALGRTAVISTIVASAVIQFSGAALPGVQCWNTNPENIDSVPSRVWDWSDAQVLEGPSLLVGDGWHAAGHVTCEL